MVEQITHSMEDCTVLEEGINQVLSSLAAGKLEHIERHLEAWSAGEIAAIIEGLPPTMRRQFWHMLTEPSQGEVLTWLSDQVRAGLLGEMEPEAVVAATSFMESADLADIIDVVSDEMGEAIMDSLGAEDRSQLENQMAYAEGSAGRLMRREWVAVRSDVKMEAVVRYLHLRGAMPTQTDGLMVIDRAGRYEGKLPVNSLLTLDSGMAVGEAMLKDADFVHTGESISDIALMFERRELLSLAVLDDDHHLVGRITVDDALSIIRAEAEAPMMQMAGLKEDEDLFAPVFPSALRRMFWLAINLATAFLASWVIGRFEAALEQIVALAVLMPIVASMGGIAGSQSLTLSIRGLALGQITHSNTRWLAVKEIVIAAINGITWAVVVGVLSWLWFSNVGIALVLGAAMLINLLVAAVSGVTVPLLLERAGIDPALSGGVILTTVTDIVGFVSFLGLATWLLL